MPNFFGPRHTANSSSSTGQQWESYKTQSQPKSPNSDYCHCHKGQNAGNASGNQSAYHGPSHPVFQTNGQTNGQSQNQLFEESVVYKHVIKAKQLAHEMSQRFTLLQNTKTPTGNLLSDLDRKYPGLLCHLYEEMAELMNDVLGEYHKTHQRTTKFPHDPKDFAQ